MQRDKKAWLSIGSDSFGRSVLESNSKDLRRSIYFIKDKKAGEEINLDDIKRIRPGKGLAPKFFNDLIGKRIKYDVKRGDPTSWDIFED